MPKSEWPKSVLAKFAEIRASKEKLTPEQREEKLRELVYDVAGQMASIAMLHRYDYGASEERNALIKDQVDRVVDFFREEHGGI